MSAEDDREDNSQELGEEEEMAAIRAQLKMKKEELIAVEDDLKLIISRKEALIQENQQLQNQPKGLSPSMRQVYQSRIKKCFTDIQRSLFSIKENIKRIQNPQPMPTHKQSQNRQNIQHNPEEEVKRALPTSFNLYYRKGSLGTGLGLGLETRPKWPSFKKEYKWNSYGFNERMREIDRELREFTNKLNRPQLHRVSEYRSNQVVADAMRVLGDLKDQSTRLRRYLR